MMETLLKSKPAFAPPGGKCRFAFSLSYLYNIMIGRLDDRGKVFMEVKYLELLKILFEKNTWITAGSLSDSLNLSVRTIKSYIRELNTTYPGIIASSVKGYLINTEIGAQALKNKKSQIPQTARERAAYVIIRILKSKTPLSVYDLCEELFISHTTFRTVQERIKRQIEPFDLTLETSANLILIRGMEKNKRRLLSSFLYHESNENFVNFEAIKNVFMDIDIEFIKHTILEVLNEYHYFINDYSLNNLVLHFTIAIDRIQNHYTEGTFTEPEQHLLFHEYELSKKVIKRLEDYFQIVFSAGEIYEMTLLLISRATSLNYETITMDNLALFIGQDCIDLIHELINSISSYYYINLYEPEFFVRFALHIKNLLIRSQNNCFSKNPLTNNIKVSCPLIYDDAVVLSSIIKERTGISINEDEIAYIAFHIGSALEAQKELASRLSTIIYCPNYYNMGTRLYDTLNSRFNADLLIANIVTEESKLAKITKCDLIIATVPFNTLLPIPHIQVQPFLRESDIQTIYQKITEIKFSKKRETFTTYLKQIVIPDFFEHSTTPRSREDIIHYLCQRLYQQGYVHQNFESEVLERERMSSTGFQNFAIPHALKMNAIKTGMFIYVSSTPIDWNGVPVSLVILLCFNREERYIFNEIFEPLTMILTNGSNLKKLLSLPDYDSFIRFLSSSF